MNGLNLLQTLFAGQLTDGKALKTLQDPENRGFLEALLETDLLRDSGLTVEDLEAWIADAGGKGLPPAAALLQPAGPEAEGEFADSAPVLERPAMDPVAADEGMPLDEDLRSLELAAPIQPSGEGLGAGAGEQRSVAEASGQQLAARLAFLDQLQVRRQLGAAQSGETGARRESEGLPGLQSYAQTSQLVDGGPRAVPLPTFSVGTPMDQSGWGQALGERLVMMAKQDVQHARIQLNPRELGPLEVNISMKDDKTTIHFMAQHAVTREALEAELPRLRIMMQENGFENLDVNVGRDEGRQLAGEGQEQDSRDAGGEDETAGDDNAGQSELAARPRGLVDHYA